MGSTWFGQVFTIIDERPCKFVVSGAEIDDTSNPLDQIAIKYMFELADPNKSNDISPFVVIATGKLSRDYFYNDSDGLHNESIRFGLLSKRKNSEQKEFYFMSNNWESLRSDRKLEGPELRKEIIYFFYNIIKFWPDQGVSISDLQDNFYITKEEASDWQRTLFQEELLIEKGGFTSFRENRGHVNLQTFKLNPKKFKEVKEELFESTRKHKLIDVSSHRYFKLNPTHSEITGKFALVLMPFKEGEFPQEVFDKVFEPVVRKILAINCVKVNSDKFKDFLENKIYSHIIKSELIISELSTENPNVIYELGLSFAFEKNIITTFFNKFAKTEQRLSFDYEHFDTIFYDDYNELERELKDALEAIKSGSSVSYNPSSS